MPPTVFAQTDHVRHDRAGSVLLVEDNDEFRDALAEFVRTLGYDVQAFGSAEAALDAVAATAARPALLITDIRLPHLNGVDLVTRLRRSHPSTPVIVVSSLTRDEAIHAGVESPPERFFRKPPNLAQLADAIGAATARGERD